MDQTKKALCAGRSVPAFAIFALIALCACAYRVLTLGPVALNGFDEHAYLFFIKTFAAKGFAGLRELIAQFPVNENLSKGPLPFRIGFIVAGWLSCLLLGSYSVESLAALSFIAGILTIAVAYLLLKEWFSRGTAFTAALLLIVSPLMTGLSRRALQDPFFALIVVTAMWLYHLSWTRPRFSTLLFLAAALLAGFLTKESMLFLYPAFAAAALYYRQTVPVNPGFRIAIPFLIAPALYACFCSWLAGGFHNVFSAYAAYAAMQDTIAYALKFQKGPWFRYMVDFMLVSPATCLLSVAGMICAARDTDTRGRSFSAIYLLGGLAVFSILPLLNLRMVLFLDLPLRALAALGILALARTLTPGRAFSAGVIALTAIILALDVSQFFRLFVMAHVYDPVTSALIAANGFVR